MEEEVMEKWMKQRLAGVNVVSTNGSLLAEAIVDFLRERGLEVCFFPKVMKLRHDALSEVHLPTNFPGQNITFVVAEYSRDANRGLLETQQTLYALWNCACMCRYAIYPFFLTSKFGRRNPVAYQGVGFQYACLKSVGCQGMVTVEVDTQQVRGFLRDLHFDNLSWQQMLAEHLLEKGYFDSETLIFAPSWVESRYQLLLGKLSEEAKVILSLPREVASPELKGQQKQYTDFLAQVVPGKRVLLLDFVLNTGVTLAHAVRYFRCLEAREITAALPHVIMSNALEELRQNLPDHLIVSNTTGQEERLREICSPEVLDVTALIGEKIIDIAHEYAIMGE